MAKQHFLQLAQSYKKDINLSSGWYMSEKLDGTRCLWDGGVTRGLDVYDVPFANVEKKGRFLTGTVCTGLWSRYGNPILAPDWFLDKLPPFICDGELWAGRGRFQICRSVVAKRPDALGWSKGWGDVKYVIYDAPSIQSVFGDRVIDNKPNFVKTFDGVAEWVRARIEEINSRKRIDANKLLGQCPNRLFEMVQRFLRVHVSETDVTSVHTQILLPPTDWESLLNRALQGITLGGGEGLVLRNRMGEWVPERSWDILKVKMENDAEGMIVGYTAGLGKYLGMVGSFEVADASGNIFGLSGFTDDERRLDSEPSVWARANPGAKLLDSHGSQQFPRGTVVTYKFRELTDDGKPKEAKFWRLKEGE